MGFKYFAISALKNQKDYSERKQSFVVFPITCVSFYSYRKKWVSVSQQTRF